MDVLSTIAVTIVVGLVIGSLGKAVAPGSRDNIPLWLTLVCGILGAAIGNYLYFAVFGVAEGYDGDMYDTGSGPDWWRHAWQVGSAAVLVVIAATITSRRDRAGS